MYICRFVCTQVCVCVMADTVPIWILCGVSSSQRGTEQFASNIRRAIVRSVRGARYIAYFFGAHKHTHAHTSTYHPHPPPSQSNCTSARGKCTHFTGYRNNEVYELFIYTHIVVRITLHTHIHNAFAFSWYTLSKSHARNWHIRQRKGRRRSTRDYIIFLRIRETVSHQIEPSLPQHDDLWQPPQLYENASIWVLNGIIIAAKIITSSSRRWCFELL